MLPHWKALKLHPSNSSTEPPSGGHPFGMVQADIFRDPTLPSGVKLVYTCLATYADRNRVAFPSQQTIAADTGLSPSSVKRAVRIGLEAGLFEVVPTQVQNRYRLRDLGVGGYVIGSGPVGHGDPSEGSRGPAGSVTVTPKQDQRTRPASQTRTSSDAYAASGHRASAPTAMKIFTPRDFHRWDDGGRVHQYLVSAALSALKAAGMQPADDAANRIGHALKVTSGDGIERKQLVKMLEGTLVLAGTADATWGSLARRASRAS